MKERYLIIDGVNIAVSEEVYAEYKRPEWRESKQFHARKEQECSLELFADFGYNIAINQKSVEDIVGDSELYNELNIAISKLEKSEQAIIIARYFDNISERELSRNLNIPRKTLSYKTIKILEKLKFLLKSF